MKTLSALSAKPIQNMVCLHCILIRIPCKTIFHLSKCYRIQVCSFQMDQISTGNYVGVILCGCLAGLNI